METLGREGKNLGTCVGDAKRVFKLRGKGFVFRDRRPAIRQNFHIIFARVQHRLDREDHAFLQDSAFARASVMQDRGVDMKSLARSVTAEIAHD